jgi:homotetrameric cytidine deaminase
MSSLESAAQQVALRAYAPYSRFRVGAALLLTDGSIFTGCNVENISFGLTICAERSAVVSAVASNGPMIRIAGIAVTNLNEAASPPCGACRQVLSEFVTDDAVISFKTLDSTERRPFAELLPFNFSQW